MTHKVKHIVMFDFSTLKEDQKNKFIEDFENLKDAPHVLEFEWGTENNAEDSSLGFTHCFILTFNDFESRTHYLHSKEHRDFEKKVMEVRNKVLVFDFESKKVK